MAEITPEDARHVLWAIDDPRGYEPGSFTTALLQAITKADQTNRARLYRAFPGLVQAALLAGTEGGREALVEIAETRS